MDAARLQERCIALAALAAPTNAAAARNAKQKPQMHAPTKLLQAGSTLSAEECSILLDWIASLMMQPGQSTSSASQQQLPTHPLTTHVLRLFRPVLSSLLARVWSDDDTHFASAAAFLHASEVLTHIATICPQVLPSVVSWFRRSPFSLPSVLSAASGSGASSDATQLSVSFIALRLLQADATSFRHLWDWSPFLALLTGRTNLVRFLAASAVALLLQMNQTDQSRLISQSILTAADDNEPEAVYLQYRNSVTVEQSLMWVESKENDAQSGVLTVAESDAIAAAAPSSADASLKDKQLSALMVSLGGVLLPRRQASAAAVAPADSAAAAPAGMVHVSSTAGNLRAIALAICESRPILLEGPAGAGKSLLVEECARVTGNLHDLVRLHLDDQMDSKTLLGTYTCTDIPGEFKWVAGALTQAVMDGRWVIIEDIDRCPFEILSAIISLLERRELYLAGRGATIHAAPGFQLFATKTVASATANVVTESTPLLHALFSRVYIQPLTYQELCVIVAHTFGGAVPKKLVQEILRTFTAFVQLKSDATTETDATDAATATAAPATSLLGSGRKYTTRDLIKWCARIRTVLVSTGFNAQGTNEHLTQQMHEEIFLGALEIFAAPIPTPVRALTAAVASANTAAASATAAAATAVPNPRLAVTEELACLWRIDPDRMHFLTNAYKPRLDVTPNALKLGRVTLNRRAAKAAKDVAATMASFAFTKYSLSMMEHICMSVLLSEPVLLVSDTGVGKTTTIQFLANLMGKKLHVQNLNQQSDSADLIGGYKPVEVSKLIIPLMNSFGSLFPRTFSRAQNADFLNKLRRQFEDKAWPQLVKMMRQTVESAEKKLAKAPATTATEETAAARKQAKTANATSASSSAASPSLLEQWSTFSTQLAHFAHQLSQLSSSFVFHFNEGALVTALRNGDWILLDEINLASSETLERLSGILEGASGSLSLTERGDSDALVRHPDFRLFAAMNPATDAGKKNLPPSVRARFTEMYVDEMTDREDLAVVIKQYLEPSQVPGAATVAPPITDAPIPYDGIVSFYLAARSMSSTGLIQEGSNNNPSSSNTKPHYSLRTLCRSLQFAKDIIALYGFSFERALYEGLIMSFCTLLTPDSSRKLQDVLVKSLHFAPSALALDVLPRKPTTAGQEFELIGDSFWIPCGPEDRPESLTAKFIPTASVRHRLKQLSRGMLTGKYPILLQGPTSGGKTSLVEYLALKTGHKFVRINNHEHTDLQEYLGSYVTDPQSGKLVFQEGVLVDAVRRGHWIVLDELNLAPSEVLEALNRLLDDNRELFLPETQETIRPHPHFMLFATQNPSGGIYGGRKVLSKAFRNRFITLHIDDLPESEIEEILHLRCRLPPSYCKAMIGTMKTLATRREKTNVFAGKRSFMTPRDLYRWGERGPTSYQQLAEDGFMLLGERLRTDDAKAIVKEVLEKHCKVKIDEARLYSQESVDVLIQQLLASMHPDQSANNAAALLDPTSAANAANKEAQQIGKIAWTYNMRRLFIQVGRCLLFEEPVLLVGETGCGKTTVCQLFSLVLAQLLRVINCHQHTESSDFLGGLRPVRGKDKTAAELRVAVKDFLELYQQIQVVIGESAAATAVDDADDEKEAITPLSLSPLSEDAAGVLTSLSSPSCTTSLGDLMKLFTEYSSPLVSFEKRLAAATAKHDAIVTAEKERQAAERQTQKRKSKKARKAAAAAAAEADVDMEDVTPTVALPPAPVAPLPAAEWTSLIARIASINALNTRFQSLFEWVDGALVQSLRAGELLLIDEISLADDAVLERLNSVLESSRTLFLAEKGGKVPDVIKAAPAFRVFATMNPGGDFGKKELSPALRNRFTEIWVPPFSNKTDLLRIITERMAFVELHPYAESILEFVQWFNRNTKANETADAAAAQATTVTVATAAGDSTAVVATPAAKKASGPTGSKRYLSLRDILGWVSFMNQCLKLHSGSRALTNSVAMSGFHAYLHGSALTVLDGLGIGSTDSDAQILQLKNLSIDQLLNVLPPTDRAALEANVDQAALIKRNLIAPSSASGDDADVILSTPTHFGIAPFVIAKGACDNAGKVQYALQAQTTQMNLLRVLRSLTLPKAILLEGPPGVGKTSLLTTLAAASGHKIVRINLSEQTDMMDLLGMDLPVPGGNGGEFHWCDGIFLQALKAGDWVLLDELNLASQSVLEGLNAVLDHRAQVFIPELDATFDCPSTFRIFACQNPMSQGGGRKGLPASFLNRFTKVYLDSLQTNDLLFISSTMNPHIPRTVMDDMIRFNSRIHHETMVTRKIGRKGFPWEFNLRDVFKLCELMRREKETPAVVQKRGAADVDATACTPPNPGKYIDLIYLQRMRTLEDRSKIGVIYDEIFGASSRAREEADSLPTASTSTTPLVIDEFPTFHLADSHVQIGHAFLPRRSDISASPISYQGQSQPLLVLKQLLRPLSHLVTCMQYNFPTILLGGASTGKTSLVRLLAQLTHNPLHEILMTSGIDSSELLGCFEQVDLTRHKKAVLNQTSRLVQLVLAKAILNGTAANSADKDERMTDAESTTVTVKGKKSTKRSRDGKLTPTADMSALSVSSPATVDAHQHVSQLLHTWSLLDASFNSTAAKSASLLAQADESESAQQLSTAAFSAEQYALLQSLLNGIESLLPSLSAALDFTIPSALRPSLLLKQAEHIQSLAHASAGKVIGNFEWIDGSLISALENGEWILLDNVNFCNPTVLDRLNPLLEIDGVLLVNECGLVDGAARIIKPHPNFRMILAMDPRYGEISRAMRNRCLEICLVNPITANVITAAAKTVQPTATATKALAQLPSTSASPHHQDLLSIVNSLGIFGLAIPQFMVGIHATLSNFANAPHAASHSNASTAALKSLSVRNLKHWTLLCAQQVQSGGVPTRSVGAGGDAAHGLFASLWLTFQHAYNLSLTNRSGLDKFSDDLTALFRREYARIVLQQASANETRAPSSLLAPTLWPTQSHALTPLAASAPRDVEIQGSVLKYLAQLALGQSVSPRDEHLLGVFRQAASAQAGASVGALSFLPDSVWKFVFGLSQSAAATKSEQITAVKQDEPQTTVAVKEGEPLPVSALDQHFLMPTSSLTPTFSHSAHPLHAHPTSLQLFHLACIAFIEYSHAQDYTRRISWLQRELVSGPLFARSSDDQSSATIGTPTTDHTTAHLRKEVDLAIQTMTAIYAHPIVSEYTQNMARVIETCGFDAGIVRSGLNPHLDATFLDLLRTRANPAVHAQLDQLVSQWSVVQLLLQSTYQSLRESAVYTGVPLLMSQPSNLSLLELSYACYTNLIQSQRVSSLVSGISSELILQIYPFWTAMQGLEKNLLEHAFQMANTQGADIDRVRAFHSALARLIHDKNYFWLTIYSTKKLLGGANRATNEPTGNTIDAIVSQIHIRWKVISKRIQEVVALVPALASTTKSASTPSSAAGLVASYANFQSFFTRLQSTLQGTTHSSTSLVGVKNTLWKFGGHPRLPREKALETIEIELQAIERQIQYRPTNNSMSDGVDSQSTSSSTNNRGTQPFFIVDANFKQVLLEAFVNLKFLYLQGEEDDDDEAKEADHQSLLATLATLPGVLQSKLQAAIDADKKQLDSMRFHVQIVGEGEESLEELGFDADSAVKQEHDDDAMQDGDETDASRPSSQFLSVSADASATLSSRFSDQTSHKKSFIMPQLLPIFDLAYLEFSRVVIAHVQYIGFAASQMRHIMLVARQTKKAPDAARLHTLASSLQSALSSLLSFLPSLLQFYTSKTSAISGLLDLHALKVMELVGGGLVEAIGDALARRVTESESVFVKLLAGEKVQTLLTHLPAILQEVQYHYANFHRRFLHSNATALQTHSARELDTSFVLTPIKSLLVLDLISQSLNISLIHRHAKRIQLQMLGEFLARDLIRAPRAAGRTETGLVLTGASARSTAVHASLLECVALLTNFHSALVCFASYFTVAAEYERIVHFLNTLVQLALDTRATARQLPTTVPDEVKQAISRVQDPRLYSFVNTLVLPFLQVLLTHMALLRSPAGLGATDGHVMHLGHATLLLALLKFYLLLPVSPVDSNQKYFVLLRDETYFSTANRQRLELAQWQESLRSGRAQSHEITHLQAAFHQYAASIASLHKKVTYRRFDPEHTKPFHMLFQEFHRFTNTFVDIQKLQTNFIQPMTATGPAANRTGEESAESRARLAEELSSFQTNSSEFILRVQSTFSEYPDFIVPLLTELFGIQHGLSLMQYGWQERVDQEQRLLAAQRAIGTAADKNKLVYQTIRALVCFPFGAVNEADEVVPASTVVPGTVSPGLIPPLHHLTHASILSSLDALCRSAVSLLKDQAITRKAATREAAETSDVDPDTAANEIIATATLKSRTSTFYAMRLHILSIVLQRILLFSKVSGRLTPDLLRILDALFKSFIDIYKSNEARAALRAAEEAELYKYKETKQDVLTEEERDKLELQALFPDYSADFHDIVGSDGLPNMDEAVEERERRQKQYQEAQEAAARAKQDSDDEYGILNLSAEHLNTIYNTFTAIFSIQKASLMTPAVTANVNFTDAESESYIHSYSDSYEIGATLLHALSMQGMLASTSVIASPTRFEHELKSGHLFLLCKSLSALSFASSTGEDNVNAIMESFMSEETDEVAGGAITVNPDDGSADAARFAVHTDELEEAIKIDGKTGTKQSGVLAQSAAAAKKSKIDWSKFPDLYHSSNIEEYRKLEKPLTLLMLRLRQLLNQFANHPILVQLIQLAHRVLNLSSATPLMKILTGLELLLKKSEEWEKYASRFVSIKKELVELGILVARWRKMELYTWPKALASREQVFHQAALRGWFHLYGLIHTDDEGVKRFFPDGTFATEEETIAAFMQKLYEALDEFLQNSNLGELKTRMSILLGFYQQMNLEIVEGFGLESRESHLPPADRAHRMSLPLRTRIQHLLLNLYQFYEQFLPHVDDLVKAKKAPIEKSLREQVRLAKWDLSNYWSLKESSEKSHRKLQKYSKDYEEVLKTKFQTIISKEDERDTKEGDDTVPFGRVGLEVAEARREIERVTKKLRKEAEKAKKKAEKKKGDAAAKGTDFQQDEAKPDEEEKEDFGLPSLAQSLTILLPDTELYLSDREKWDAWFQNNQEAGEDVAVSDDSSLPARIPSIAAYQSRLPTLFHKMHVLSQKSILSAAYSEARQESLLELEEFSVHLIARVQRLTNSETKFTYKKKAFVDVMKSLREMGLSHHVSVTKKASATNAASYTVDVVNKSTTAAFHEQTASIPTLFLQSPLTSIFLKSSAQLPLSKSETYEFMRSLAKKCESYLYRVWTGVKKMRLRATNFNKDLNAAEVQKAKGMIEHAFFMACNQREKVSQVAVEYHTTRKWMEWIKELDVDDATDANAMPNTAVVAAATPSTTSVPSWSARFWSHKHLLDSLFASTKYLNLLYGRMHDTMLTQDTQHLKSQLEDAKSRVLRVLAVLSAAKVELDNKIAKLFPNLQLAHTTTANDDANATSAILHTAAESCLELNDLPNAQFLLGNIEQVLSTVTTRDADASATPQEEEGSIIEMPFIGTTSTFNELVISLIRSKYEIQAQAQAVVTTNSVAVQKVDPATTVALTDSFMATYHSLVSMLLLSVQSAHKHAKSLAEAAAHRAKVAAGEIEASAHDPVAKLLVDEQAISETAVSSSHLEQVNQKLHQLTATLNQIKVLRQSTADARITAVYHSYRVSLHNLLPLLDQVVLLTERTLGGTLNLHRSYLKLSHVLLSVLNKILARGFCRKPDEPEDQEEGETEEKEGTGMGEGEGQKDVSNEITDEEQLLGTQDQLEKDANAEQKPPPEKQPDTDEGVEMENDFDGDMHDVPDENDQEKDPNDDDDKDKEELDREMGDLGDKQDVVDEKLWEDSDDDDDQSPEEKQQKKQEEKYERDAPVDGAPEDDEIMAKEDGADDGPDNEPPKDPAKPPQEKQPEIAEDDQQEPPAEEDEDGEDDHGGPINEENEDKFEDKQGPDAMNNLPDDLALDDDEKDEKEGEADGDEDMPDEDGEEDDTKMDEDAAETLDQDKQAQLEEDGAEEDDGKGEDIGEDLEKNEVDDSPDENNPDEPQPEEAANTVEAPEQTPDAPPEEEDDTQEPDVERPDQHAAPDNKDTDQGAHRVAGGDQGHAGVDEHEEKEKKEQPPAPAQDDQDRSDADQQRNEDQTVDQANSNDAAQGTESDWQPQSAQSHPMQQTSEKDKKKKKKPEKQTPNPFKSLGDANKKWAERLKILDADESKEDNDTTQLEEDGDDDDADPDAMDGTFENVSEDQKADTQMLGPVEQKLDADEMPKIKPQEAEEPQPEEEEKELFDEADPKRQEDEEAPKDRDERSKQESRKRGGAQQLNPTRMADPIPDEDEDMAPAEEDQDETLFDPFEGAPDEEAEETLESRIGAMDDIAQAKSESHPSDPNDPAHQEWLQQLRDDLDAALQEWDSATDAHAHAQALWSKFTELTSDLSSSLTESLRMILEPMIATKLKGDYKTGKRINIKKIIPYIASSFRKDKIWLKRTKPNKRHYQVMVAIDDSASMRNNKAGRLALEAMTVLCKALSALEVGELAIASFGNGVRLLHPFTKPFTDESGAFTVGQFQFGQQFTRWPDLLEHTVSILDEAKAIGGPSSGEHHQLVFIISDARVQQDRETVAKWTREALSKNQLLVLIIVESGDVKDSILSTKTVSYPNGKMKISDYLDDFPFPYYILLRDIASLPEIVADSLRQWFTLLASHV